MDDPKRAYKRTFASALLGLRADSRFRSQDELAIAIGVSPATYRRWENLEADNLPDAWEVKRLSEELGVDVEPLVLPEEMSPRERELAR